MVIVEGPDGAGKSTLISQLQERYGLEVAPRVVTKGAEAMVDLQRWVEDNVDQGFQYKIFDRHRLISEFIYGPLLRQQQQPGFTDLGWSWHFLDQLYTRVNPLVIYCLPPLEVVAENVYLSGDENKVVLDHIEAMYTAYVHRASLDLTFRPNMTLVWDYTRDFMLETDPLRFFDNKMAYAKERANQ